MDKLPPAVKDAFVIDSLNDKLVHQGKVRDTYQIDDETLLVVATDRISIFDFVLPAQIPQKGEVLSALTHFWLTQILDNLPHHLLASPENPEKNLAYALSRQYPDIPLERSLAVRKESIPPYEMIYRWHLGGSAYKDYEQSGKVAGTTMPPHIQKWGRLKKPVFTPSTKSDSGHDVNITVSKFLSQTSKAGYDAMLLFELAYNRAYIYAASRGILILDTKFEGGRVIADEVLTPDSSRFTTPDSWRQAMSAKKDPIFYDKEPIRDWGRTVVTPFTQDNESITGINNLNPSNPEHLKFVHGLTVPQIVVMEAVHRYQKIFEMLVEMTPKDYQQKYLF